MYYIFFNIPEMLLRIWKFVKIIYIVNVLIAMRKYGNVNTVLVII